ncbi:hemicentin-1-like [Uloborus diversus]|uniref:hemicentin-1-like n=1 Tax=Uloborus diversus TaxID=327109 RepID=UPI00240A58EF|nr:hemicentin-1-like [Uloborus diversus]
MANGMKCSSMVLFITICVLSFQVAKTVYTRNYYGLKEAFEEDIPQGASTLAFVFDITGSMYDDLVQVIAGAARILSTILARREKAIYNYVLVPFHDPDVGPATVTTDPDLFQRQLKDLYVQGGGDCPEMSIGAIKLALEVCLPNSHIYVFTDARAKDYYLLDDVLKLIQRKQSQVVFVMTGDCGNHSHPGYQAYERIASTSSGQVFHLMKSDVDEVLNFVRVSLQARKVNLFAVDRSAGDLKEFEFDVDNSLREFTISVSGENPMITVINSRGEVIDQRKGLLELLNHKNISIVNIKDPEPGRWKLRINSEASHTIRATGLSKIDFVHGFSRQPTASLKETYHRPLKGAPTYLLVNATDLPEPATFKNVKIVDLEGNNLQDIPLYRFPGSNLFNATTFFPPNEYFYLKVAGSDEYGYPIERTTSTAISAQLPDVPEVNTRSRMNGYYDEDVDLRCYIQSLVPFSVIWYKEGVPISQEQRFPQTTEVILTVPEVTMLSEGFYSCNASNIAGKSSSVIFLDVKEPPPTITRTGNVTGTIGDTAVLSCEVQSIVEHNVTWSKIVPDEQNIGYVKSIPIPDIARVIIYPNDSLVIRNVSPEDEGWYKCSAANDGGVSQDHIYLHTYTSPKVVIIPEKKNFASGDFINISCEASGYPEPSIRWVWSPVHNQNFFSGRSEVKGKHLIIHSADPKDEGRYDCIATNLAGTQIGSTHLYFIEIPLITMPDKEVIVKNGDQATLRCIAEGIPDPKVKWYKSGTEIQPLSYIQITSDGSLVIYDVQETDAGNYTCVAENEAGKAKETMSLNVGSKPSLVKLPASATVEILQNTSIPCFAVGTPIPVITWHFENGSTIIDSDKFSISSEGSLQVQGADLSVPGKYMCRAVNKFGSDKQVVELSLSGIRKPVLSPLPAFVDVPKGEKLMIPCIALDGNPKPDVIWLKEGKPVLPEQGIKVNGNKLEIQRVSEVHEANYSCIAVNIGGNDTKDLYINVLYQPVISEANQELSVVEGSTINLPCNVEGDPKPLISWYKNGIELTSNEIFSLENDGSLKVKFVGEEHEGDYTCSASNIVGTSDQVVKLIVKVPPKILPSEEIYNVVEGHVAMMPCRSYGKPAALIKWKHPHQVQSYLDKYTMYNGSLQFRPKYDDGGIYICEATNEVGQAKSEVVLNVLVPPVAKIITPVPLTAKMGSRVSLFCETSGHPEPKIHWNKENNLIHSSDLIFIQNGTLTIHKAESQDQGWYTCFAENNAGSSSDKAFLSIHESPQISSSYSSPQNLTAIVGDKIDINCNATGYPIPEIIWTEPKENMIHQIEKNIIHISFVQESDAGTYICTAQNPAGFDVRVFNLSVYAPPVLITSFSQDLEITRGSDIALDCTTVASPLPETMWYKNNQVFLDSKENKLIKDNNQTMILKNVTILDAGQYTCIASNPVGEISKLFKLRVSVAPNFLRPYVRQHRILMNNSLQLDCSTDGLPEPMFVWRKNGLLITHALFPGVEFMNSKSLLKIDHVQESDAGTYSCVAINKIGSSSRDFEVSVLGTPQIQGENLEEKEIMLQEITSLNCVAFGNPSPTVHWYKDGKEMLLNNVGQFTENNNQQLTILKTEEADSGIYTCLATNEVGQARKSFKLTVLALPQIKDQSVTETFRVKENDDLNLHCEAVGTPSPTIMWMKNNNLLPATLYPEETTLRLHNVTKNDAGRYACVASNKVGTDEKDFNVIIMSPPRVEKPSTYFKHPLKEERKESLENQPIVLVCPFSANPFPHFIWMKDSKMIDASIDPFISISNNGKNLHIKHAKAEHIGKYVCIAKNEAGESKYEFLIDVFVPPSVTAELKSNLEIKEAEALNMNCNATGNPKPSVLWLKDGSEVEEYLNKIQFSPDHSSIKIISVEAHHSGKYICIVTNIAGSTEKEFNVDVLTSPRLNSKSEEAVGRPTTYVNKPVTLTCPISGNPAPQIKWVKNRKEIDPRDGNVFIHDNGLKLSFLRTKTEDSGLYTCIADNGVGNTSYKFELEILMHPKIEQKDIKKAYYVKEGESITIKCVVTGYPKPIITWLKDSDIVPLHSSPHIYFTENFQSLKLNHATLKDAGKYTCIAGNEIGTAEQDFKIDVQVPPKLEASEEKPENKSAILNKPVSLSCPVSGIPPPRVKWYKNGQLINSQVNRNILLSSDGRKLKIFRTQETDSATYVCIAANDVGKVEKEFNLNIQVPPRIVETNSVLDYYSEDKDEKQNELKAVEDESAQLECYVDGNPKPLILWIKDGHLINADSNDHYKIYHDGQLLEVDDVKPYDAGLYTCVASNIAGTREKNFALDVYSPPRIKGPNFETHQVLPNRPSALECFVDSNPSSAIGWFKDGVKINSENTLLKIIEDGQVLQFVKSSASDHGHYTCIAENAVGKTEKNFKVDVFAAPVIQASTFKQKVLENEKVSMECVANGNPEPNIIWLKDGIMLSEELLKNVSIYKVSDDTMLKISEAKSYHSGKYRCIATNAAGSTEKLFDLYVTVPPRIVNTSEPNLTVFIHNFVTMLCVAEAEPAPSISWFKDGEVLNENTDPFIHILQEEQKLQILRTRESDHGQYSCEASNPAGKDSRLFMLNVLVPPRVRNIIQEDSRTNVIEGNSTEIKCYVHGNPQPTVSWKKDGQIMFPDRTFKMQLLDNNQLLQIANVEAEDGGRYTCVATSPLGTEERHFDLHVQVPPKIYDDQNTDYVALLNKPLTIHCEADGTPKPVITWMKNGHLIDPFLDPNLQSLKEESALLIRRARLEDSGKYTCIATSTAGQDERNFNIHVHTPASVDDTNLKEEVLGLLNETTVFLCPATGIPLPSISWLKDGDHIEHVNQDTKYQFLEGGKTFKVNFVNENDAGKYTCVAFNDAGSDEINYFLDVMTPPVMTPAHNESKIKSKEGDTVLFDCPVLDNNHIGAVTWKKNGNLINSISLPPNFEFSPDNKRLKIIKPQAYDSGVFTCIASNSAGDSEHEMELLVLAPAKITHPLDNITAIYVKEQHSITLDCMTAGHPKPIITWLKDDLPLFQQPNLSFPAFGKLKIISSSIHDAGLYTCHSENEGGWDEKFYNLTVYVPPTINVSSHGLHKVGLQNSVLTLDCIAKGIPKPRVLWYKGSQMLISGPRVTFLQDGEKLKISHITTADAGKYTCLAINEAGDTEAEHFVKVHVPPSIEQASIQNSKDPIVNQTVRIFCDAFGLPFPTITWYHNGALIYQNDSRFSFSGAGQYLDILSVQSTDSGTYACEAENIVGHTRKEVPLTVSVPPDIEANGRSREYFVILGKPTRIDCEASGTPLPRITWLKNGLPLPKSENVQQINNNRALFFTYALTDEAGEYTCIATNNAGSVEQKFNLTVLVPPKFTHDQKDKVLPIVLGSSGRITCPVVGHPIPDIVWSKDGVVLSDKENIFINSTNLEISNSDSSHNGNYACEASNIAGKVNRMYTVKVNVPAKIEGSDETTFIASVVGSSVTINCPASGTPLPKVVWFKNSIPIIPRLLPNVHIENQGLQLTVLNPQLKDSAKYSCLATNDVGNASRDFTLSILEPPFIANDSSIVKVLAGKDAVLTCKASGYPAPEIDWLKNNSPLLLTNSKYAKMENSSIHVSNVNLEDAGNYTCRATNEAGLHHKNFTLMVTAPPVIKDMENVQKVLAGETVFLHCDAKGSPPPIIMWHKDSTLILNSKEHQIFPDGTLHFPIANESHSGVYKCLAENEVGSFEAVRRLHVLSSPKIIENYLTKYETTQAQPAVLKCAAEGYPKPVISWEHNSRSMDLFNPRYKLYPSGDLHISLTQPSDMGTYTCIAKNEAGSDTRDIDLVVFVPPSVNISGPSAITAVRGRTVTSVCSAKGFPPPKISWQKNGIPFLSSTSDITGQLTLENIQPEDSGSYVCIAVNSAGRDHKSISLEVHVPPVIVELPKSEDLSVGDTLVLICEASGQPLPGITWLLNNTQVTGSAYSAFGHSKLVVENVGKEDQGTYICLAQNAAGEKKAAAAVRVRAPPIIMESSDVKSVQLKETVILDCLVTGDPSPNIIWIKNGQQLISNHRLEIKSNGSLYIYNSSDHDSGQYKCIASNGFGSAERVAELIIRSKPEFIIEPHSRKIEVGNDVLMDCKVNGEPKPAVIWLKDSALVNKTDRLSILPNNSLQIIAAQLLDEGIYACTAENELGSVVVEAQLVIQVHGKWSDWQEWSSCSSSCGDGIQSRQRVCNNPLPKNGGKACIGLSSEVRHCESEPCAVDGEWGNWMEWSNCSVACGVGSRRRQRKCDNPLPKFGGRYCIGAEVQTDSCMLKKCPVDGNWGSWSLWEACSVTCGKGTQTRSRKCDNPEPLHGGQPCFGDSLEHQECELEVCAVDGEWSIWSEWSLCSSSCGGGKRERIRKCDSPSPSFGGRYCSGSHVQTDYCNNAQCPVHGSWGDWSSWGECSSSCNKGQKKRFRSCNNPIPSGGGRDCTGSSQQIEVCNAHLCPVDGKWSEWSVWSSCSVTCGIGMRSRIRTCDNPDPTFGGKDCLGDNEEFEECGDEACDVLPIQAFGHLIGAINEIDFGLSKMVANVTQVGMVQTTSAYIQNITEEIAPWMKLLVPLLTPIYWTTAYEIGQAVNGYTLTKGFFRRETQVNFATGETLYMTHIARGLDRRGNLLVDIVISGEVPEVPTNSDTKLHSYTEDYVQMGPGLIYAFSTRTYEVDGYVIPYSWNHTIVYDEAQSLMPFPTERLYANGINSSYDSEKHEMKYIISAAIGKSPSGEECTDGFSLSALGNYCSDVDECELNPCSHVCNNFPSGFSCSCLPGFALGLDGEACNDIDECTMNLDTCLSSEECINTIGSYKCLVMCKNGYQRSDDELYCIDIDECSANLHNCEQICVNSIGSFSCSCQIGYYLFGRSRCIDVDECSSLEPPCSHTCKNLPGSFICSCPKGYELQNQRNCLDIDECKLGIYSCESDQECKNVDGGYKCIAKCSPGLVRAANDTCIDIDECDDHAALCHYTQICINTYGSYHCSCFRGFYSEGAGKPCKDINECLQRPNPCSYICNNLPGDYECVCTPGLKRLPDKKTCAGIEYLDQKDHEVQHDYSTNDGDRSKEHLTDSLALRKAPNNFHCPVGFRKEANSCEDINECEDKGKCQHSCENTVGSYNCLCPEGYQLGSSGKTCQDIDECLASKIDCGPEKMCFNMRGSYECIETPCPPKYDRDPLTGYCKLACEKAGMACPPNIKYAEILAFKMIALPSGIQAYQDLIRLIAYDQDGILLPDTVFSIIENETGVPFRIRLENGKGVLYTQKNMESNQDYKIKVQAISYDMELHTILYTTKFVVFVSVSQYPY